MTAKMSALSILRVLAAAILLSLGLAIPSASQLGTETIGPAHVPGVPSWVYSHEVSPNVRNQFIILYAMLYQKELYQEEQHPKTAAANFQKLGEELYDVFGSFAGKEIPTDVPDWVWHIDDDEQIKWLHETIREKVDKNGLQGIANSSDLVPSLVPARPTTIGPPHPVPRPKLLTHEDVVKMLQNPIVVTPNFQLPQADNNAASAGLDAQLKALEDAVAQAKADVDRTYPIMQACFVSCRGSRDENACQLKCQVPFDNANKAFNDANQRVYQFSSEHHCALDHCSDAREPKGGVR